MNAGASRDDERYLGLRADLLDVLCRLGHTDPTNVSISHLCRNHFRQDSEEDLHRTIARMIADGDPISYLDDERQAVVHITDSAEARRRMKRIRTELYDL
ncbi:hypothetical protein J2751_000132 [Halorubrum alkaliphilum]|uniref:Uncharacterized protein n=1 Tax=Halorubrum alkaliphilum TaxID=261290 RepID=A0A8T4GBN8_9EURY|nr:hypothetical protein [Halorubrum alkaliphilum]